MRKGTGIGILLSVVIAMFISVFFVSENSSATKVTVTKGDTKLYYGYDSGTSAIHNTYNYTVDGETAYCAEPSEKSASGEYEYSEWDDEGARAVLLTTYGGPLYFASSSDKRFWGYINDGSYDEDKSLTWSTLYSELCKDEYTTKHSCPDYDTDNFAKVVAHAALGKIKGDTGGLGVASMQTIIDKYIDAAKTWVKNNASSYSVIPDDYMPYITSTNDKTQSIAWLVYDPQSTKEWKEYIDITDADDKKETKDEKETKTATVVPTVTASISGTGVSLDSESSGTKYYTATTAGNYTVNFTGYGGRKSSTGTNDPANPVTFDFYAYGPTSTTTSIANGSVSLSYNASTATNFTYNNAAISSSGTINATTRSAGQTAYPTALCGTMKIYNKVYTYTYHKSRTLKQKKSRTCYELYIDGVKQDGLYDYNSTNACSVSYGTPYTASGQENVAWTTDSTDTSTANASTPQTATACATIRGPLITYESFTDEDPRKQTYYSTTEVTPTISPNVNASISGAGTATAGTGTNADTLYYTAPKTETMPKTYTVNFSYGGRRTDTGTGDPTTAVFNFYAYGPIAKVNIANIENVSVYSGSISLSRSTTNSIFSKSDGRTPVSTTGTISVDWREYNDDSYPNPLCGEMKVYNTKYTFYWQHTDDEKRTRTCYKKYINGVLQSGKYNSDGTTCSSTWGNWTTVKTGPTVADTRSPHTSGYTYTSTGDAKTATRCATVRGPQEERATFRGDVYVSLDSSLTGTVTANSTTNTAVGDGLHSAYNFTTTYRITRNNDTGSTPSTATSRYAFNTTSSYPTTPGTCSGSDCKTNGLAVNAYENVKGPLNVTPHTYFTDVAIDIDRENTYCFNLSYDNEVIYRNTSIHSQTFDGRQRTCVTVSNPAKTYTTSFNATSSGTLNSHERLIEASSWDAGSLSNCNDCTEAVINNIDKNNDGTYSYHYPSSNQYYATFRHRIIRTDNPTPETLKFTLPSNTGTTWEVQQSTDGGVTWRAISDARATCNQGVGASCSPSLATYNSGSYVYNKTDVLAATLSSNNKGEYIVYCQRIAYYRNVGYRTATDTSAARAYVVNRNSVSNLDYSTPACVTIRNPRWDETETPKWPDDPNNPSVPEDQDEPADPYNPGTSTNATMRSARTHTIRVTGETTGVTVNGSAKTGESSYKATSVNVSAFFDHSLVRTDSGFDESDSTLQTALNTTAEQNFYPAHGSIYQYCVSNLNSANCHSSPFTVSTAFSGREQVNNSNGLNTVDTAGRIISLELSPLPNARTPLTRYMLTNHFTAANKNTKTRWDSSNNSGRTYTPFNVSTSRNNYTVRAGGSVRVCQDTYNTLTGWRIRYVDVMRRETYTNYPAVLGTNPTHSWFYDRTSLKSTKAEPTIPVGYTSNEHISSPLCINLSRDWNFSIESIEPSDVENFQSSSQTIASTFTINVTRDSGWNDVDVAGTRINRDYITDVDSAISIITFVIRENADRNKINSATSGGIYSSADFCSYYSQFDILDANLVSGTPSCSVSVPSEANNRRVHGKDDTPSSDGVYNDMSYAVHLQTGNIPVPTIPVGDKFCVAVGVHKRSSTSSQSFISRSTCTNISKRPAVHIEGGSVATNGGIKTSLTEIEQVVDGATTHKVFGSWTDISIIAGKPVTRMSSGNSIVENYTIASTNDIPCAVSPITIANKACRDNFNAKTGNSNAYVSESYIDLLLARYIGNNTTYEGLSNRTITINEEFYRNAYDTLHITNSESIGGNDPLVIYSHGNINITTNIKLNDAVEYSGIRLPQVLIIAEGNINIADNVSQLDAWILAKKTINTCTNADGSTIFLSSRTCDIPLRINGPVVGSNVLLRRTYGADLYEDLRTNQDEVNIRAAAETINLTPTAFFFGVSESRKGSQPHIVYTRELAPRY